MSMDDPLVHLMLTLNNVSTTITEQDNKDLLKDENLKPKQVCSLVLLLILSMFYKVGHNLQIQLYSCR